MCLWPVIQVCSFPLHFCTLYVSHFSQVILFSSMELCYINRNGTRVHEPDLHILFIWLIRLLMPSMMTRTGFNRPRTCHFPRYFDTSNSNGAATCGGSEFLLNIFFFIKTLGMFCKLKPKVAHKFNFENLPTAEQIDFHLIDHCLSSRYLLTQNFNTVNRIIHRWSTQWYVTCWWHV